MKIFSNARHWLGAPVEATEPVRDDLANWIADPLSHPALEAMSQRELGDLPFGRFHGNRSGRPDSQPSCCC